MPIVFVHGVNNRVEDADYSSGIGEKTSFLTSIFAPKLGLMPEKVSIQFPYWGDQGAKFRWGQASLPSNAGKKVALGFGEAEMREGMVAEWRNEIASRYGKGDISLSVIATNSGFAAAVDLVWDTAGLLSESMDILQLTETYLAAMNYAEANPVPTWLVQNPTISNSEFISKLFEESRCHVQSGENKTISLSIGSWVPALKEKWERFKNAPSDVASSLGTRYGRRATHLSASRFIGDILVYLDGRGDIASPGEIIDIVKAALLSAQAAKKTGDDKLIVVGHSLGGVIAYDILTYFAPEVHVDFFLSVGSQVALFEEMALYRSSQKFVPTNPATDRLEKPTNIGRWLNVFDTNDVFSFYAGTVFKDVDDYEFDTGYGLSGAHGGYFKRLSFYKKLADRVTEQKK